MLHRHLRLIVQSTSLTCEEFVTFLVQLDGEFTPPLSQRVDLAEYATKMIAKAAIVGAKQDGELVGVAAFYCNDRSSRVAYMTYLGVLPSGQRTGVGSALIAEVIELAGRAEMRSIELQTDADRQNVISFYERLGFKIINRFERYGGFRAVRLKRMLS